MAIDGLTKFITQMQDAGFKREQIHKMSELMGALDVLVQRYKVVEDVETQISQGAADPSQLWQTQAALELIPRSGVGLMRPAERQAGLKSEKLRTAALFGKK